MKTTQRKSAVAEVREEYAEKLAKAEKEDAITAVLPRPSDSICIHSDHASVTYRKGGYGDKFTFAEAVEILRLFGENVQPAEHWQDGCVSVKPGPLNEYSKKESATMDGESFAEVDMRSFGARGEYQTTELTFWARMGDHWLDVGVEFQAPWGWLPDRRVSYTRHGEVSQFQLTPKFLGEDKRRKWSSNPPGWHLSYYWADVHNFNSWADAELEKIEKAKASTVVA